MGSPCVVRARRCIPAGYDVLLADIGLRSDEDGLHE